MFQPAPGLWVDANQEKRLQSLVKSGKTPQKVAVRARIVLLAAEGVANHAIAARLDISRPTVLLWRRRFTCAGVPGLLKDARRPGRNKAVPPEAIQRVVEATLHTTPPAATHWTIRTMARAQGLSRMTVQRIWKQHGLQPHRVETFKLSRDPHFVEKLRDVVGLYLDPPDKALVLSVDEKSQIQALDRTAPLLPLRPGIPERQTHDYQRHGTSTLFAALNVLDGTIVGHCAPRHRHQEFLHFLTKLDGMIPRRREVHLILDNYGTHTHPQVKEWLAARPRYHLHFTPTSASWLNLVERFFAEITERRIRRGTFRSLPELIRAITTYIRERNKNPKRFVWTAPPKEIIRKVRKARRCLG